MTLAAGVVHHQRCILQYLALNAEVPEVELRSPPGKIEISKAGGAAREDETTRAIDRISHIQRLADRSRRSNRRHRISRSAEVRVRQSECREARTVVQVERWSRSRSRSSIREGRSTGKALLRGAGTRITRA